MKYRFLSAAVIALAVATIVACGKSSPATPSDGTGTTSVSNPGTPGSSTGRLSVSLKDSPFSEASAVLIKFSEVSAHHSGGSWFTVPFANGAENRFCDLKQLQAKTATDILGVATLETGHYTEIRLTVASAMLYFDQTPTTAGPCYSTEPTMTPSAGKAAAVVNIPSGVIKLNRPFDIDGGATVNMLLDFDGDKSIHMLGNGKYQMSPVISVVSVQ
ncbi:MAG: DUF4382 domain-containing protein [Bacteroidales bacterium]